MAQARRAAAPGCPARSLSSGSARPGIGCPGTSASSTACSSMRPMTGCVFTSAPRRAFRAPGQAFHAEPSTLHGRPSTPCLPRSRSGLPRRAFRAPYPQCGVGDCWRGGAAHHAVPASPLQPNTRQACGASGVRRRGGAHAFALHHSPAMASHRRVIGAELALVTALASSRRLLPGPLPHSANGAEPSLVTAACVGPPPAAGPASPRRGRCPRRHPSGPCWPGSRGWSRRGPR